jgi:hypothetical protein
VLAAVDDSDLGGVAIYDAASRVGGRHRRHYQTAMLVMVALSIVAALITTVFVTYGSPAVPPQQRAVSAVPRLRRSARGSAPDR